jgi:hypothetical protein
LQRRGERLRPLAQRLRQAWQEGKLAHPPELLVQSYLHMQVNRMLQDEQRPHELILYDFLARLYRSQMARGAG